MAKPVYPTRTPSDRAGLESIPIPFSYPTRHIGIGNGNGYGYGNELDLKVVDYREDQR